MNRIKSLRVFLLILVLGSSLLIPNLSAQKATLNGFPIFAYSNETHLMLGGFLIWDKQWEKENIANRNTIISNLIVTTNKQYLAFVLPRFTRKNGDLGYSADVIARRWSDKFWGIGNDTSEDAMEPFGWEEYKINLKADYRIWQELSPGIEIDLRYGDLYKTKNNGILDTQQPLGSKPAFYIGKGVSLTWDNTDRETYPTRGLRYKAGYMNYSTLHVDAQDGEESDNLLQGDFDEVNLDLNNYIPITDGIVFATQTSFMQTENAIPFTFFPELGSKLRAYDSKRFIDKTLLTQRLEPRIFPSEIPFIKQSGIMQSKFWQRMGFVFFCEFGQVAPHTRSMTWKQNHKSNGFGIRYAIIPEDKLNFRMDFGWGDNTFNFIFQAREVF